MDTNTMYQNAANNKEFNNSKHTLTNGDVLICCVDRVAGRSITKGHYRTTWLIKLADAQYSKPFSRVKAAQRLQGE